MSEATLSPPAMPPASGPSSTPAAVSSPPMDHLIDDETLADLLRRLGDVPTSRVRMRPYPGTATEADVIAVKAKENRLFELVDGTLVEKGMGYTESRWGVLLSYFIQDFLERHDLGILAGADGMLRLQFRRVRIPDVSFISWARIPDPSVLDQPIPDLVPDLAVEILSPSNTRAEMEIKLREYFAAGVRIVWYVNPPTRTARVYTSPETWTDISPDGAMEGGDILPGFRLGMRDWFDRAERRGPRG